MQYIQKLFTANMSQGIRGLRRITPRSAISQGCNKLSIKVWRLIPMTSEPIDSTKINYPSADRNKRFILEVLQKHFDHSKPGKVLEISSGTGQQAAFFASQFPNLVFQPSEFEEPLFESIRAYAEEVPSRNIKEPALIDITADPNTWGVDNDFDYILNVNMFHVTPFSCAEGFFKNGSRVLKDGGLFVTYGPYAINGVLEPQSNVDFDRNIRARDPRCGVRDIRDLKNVASIYGVFLEKVYDLPANNKCLVWQKKKTTEV